MARVQFLAQELMYAAGGPEKKKKKTNKLKSWELSGPKRLLGEGSGGLCGAVVEILDFLGI